MAHGATKEAPEQVRIQSSWGEIPQTATAVVPVGTGMQGSSKQAQDWPVELFRWALGEVCQSSGTGFQNDQGREPCKKETKQLAQKELCD